MWTRLPTGTRFERTKSECVNRKVFFLADRVVDRGGHHPDHCSHRYSQLNARTHVGERSISCRYPVRSINTAEISYNAAYSNLGFATSLPYLGGPAGAACVPSTSSGCFIDSVLSTGTKSGYVFALAIGGSAAAGGVVPSYSIIASPLTPNQTGVRYFCSFEDAVVRSSTGAITAPCSATTPALQ